MKKKKKEEEIKRAVCVSKKMFEEQVMIIKENRGVFGRPPDLMKTIYF